MRRRPDDLFCNTCPRGTVKCKIHKLNMTFCLQPLVLSSETVGENYLGRPSIQNFRRKLVICDSCTDTYFTNLLLTDDPRADCAVSSTNQQAVTQPIVCDLDNLNKEVAQRDVSSPEEEFFVKYDCLQQLSDLQLNKVHTFIFAISLVHLMLSVMVECIILPFQTQTEDQPNKDTLSLDHTIMNLQTELHEVQNERDSLSNLR